LWTVDENYCRVHYVGEDLDDLAYSRVARELNKPAREAAQREAEAAAKQARRERANRRLPPLQ
jgi:hypothetical protein